jgi:hypothetical protein
MAFHLPRSAEEYIDIKLDFGFKFLMKDNDTLKLFLNSVLPVPVVSVLEILQVRSAPVTATSSAESSPRPRSRSSPIQEITFISEECVGSATGDRGIRFDIACITDTGLIINVEMQKASQIYFHDRSLFYAASLIRRQGYRGKKWHESILARNIPDKVKRDIEEWDFELCPTFHIAIIDFSVSLSDYITSY